MGLMHFCYDFFFFRYSSFPSSPFTLKILKCEHVSVYEQALFLGKNFLILYLFELNEVFPFVPCFGWEFITFCFTSINLALILFRFVSIHSRIAANFTRRNSNSFQDACIIFLDSDKCFKKKKKKNNNNNKTLNVELAARLSQLSHKCR